MKRLITTLLPLMVFLLIIVFLFVGLRKNPHTVPTPYVGKSVPPFTAKLLKQPNRSVTEKIFLGHISLLNIFASWCAYCRVEHPVLMDIAKLGGVQLIGVDYKDPIKKAKAMLLRYGNPYAMVLVDPKGKLAINFGAYGTPETFIIDKKGIIRYRHVGPITPLDWQQQLLPLIKKL